MLKQLITAISVVCLLSVSVAQGNLNDSELCNFFNGLTDRTPSDCSERFAINKIGENNFHQRAFAVLRGITTSTDSEKAEAREELNAIRDQILIGQNWPIKTHEECLIPYAKIKPDFCGPDAPVWKQATHFGNEYNLNAVTEIKNGADWYICWDEKYLYFAARLPDDHVESVEYGKSLKSPWDGDCLEIFTMPSMRLKTYWELVINPAGKIFHGLQRNNARGGFSASLDEDMPGLKTHTKILHNSSGGDEGYFIEVAIPFHELPNYMLGNKPEPGQSVYFMMVRTNDGKRSAPRPFLYDGHNIFGYIKGTLVKSKEIN